MKIAAVHVFIRYHLTRAEKKRGEKHGKLHRVIFNPKSQVIRDIKIDIAQIVDDVANKAEYYYVVVAVRQPNGKFGYRTVTPKLMVNAA